MMCLPQVDCVVKAIGEPAGFCQLFAAMIMLMDAKGREVFIPVDEDTFLA